MHEGRHDRPLHAALRRASAYGLTAGAVRDVQAPADLLRFVCARIGATMLKRRLVFQLDGKPWLEAVAAGRRLLYAAGAQGSAAHDFSCAFETVEDAEATRSTLCTFRDMVVAAAERARRVTVQARVEQGREQDGWQGVSLRDLRSVFGLSDSPADAACVFRRFVEGAGDRLVSAAYIEGDMLYPLKAGERDLDRLAELAEDWLPDIEQVPGGLTGLSGQAGLIGWDHGSGPGPAPLAAEIDQRVLFALAVQGALPNLTCLWYAVSDANP